jgi:hypothetical protein
MAYGTGGDRAHARRCGQRDQAGGSVTLRRAIGQALAADGLVAIEIVPGYVAGNAQVEDAHIRLTSPL